LITGGPTSIFALVKIISLEDAITRLPAIVEEALAGEIIRLRSATGAELELTPVVKSTARCDVTPAQLAEAYDDPEWAAFENNCGKASN
jgi:hypothetical protein